MPVRRPLAEAGDRVVALDIRRELIDAIERTRAPAA
jgi:hypothetical protein